MGPKFIRNLEAHLRQAEGRRPKAWERERSEQHSTRSVFISEWTLAGGPYVYSTQSTLARSIFINTRGQLGLREIQKSWGKFKKKSRKSPEKVHRKIRIIPECVSEKSRENAEEVQKKFPENQFLKKSIIYSIHLKGKVNDYLMMRQYSCGILPTFLSLEAHQGKIFSYVTAIWRPKWVFSSLLPQRNVSHSTILGTSAWLIQTPQPPLVTWRRSSCWIWAGAVGWTRSVCWNFLGHINFIKIFIWLFIKWKNVQSSSLEEAMVIHVLHN